MTTTSPALIVLVRRTTAAEQRIWAYPPNDVTIPAGYELEGFTTLAAAKADRPRSLRELDGPFVMLSRALRGADPLTGEPEGGQET